MGVLPRQNTQCDCQHDSTALRYDVAFFWSINPFYHMNSMIAGTRQGQACHAGDHPGTAHRKEGSQPPDVLLSRALNSVTHKKAYVLLNLSDKHASWDWQPSIVSSCPCTQHMAAQQLLFVAAGTQVTPFQNAKQSSGKACHKGVISLPTINRHTGSQHTCSDTTSRCEPCVQHTVYRPEACRLQQLHSMLHRFIQLRGVKHHSRCTEQKVHARQQPRCW
jgi:hypothetical protein